VVAVKLLVPPPVCDPTAARRLAREFEALRGLAHPNVVRVFDAGVHEGYSFLVMELIQGLDLRSYLSPDLEEADTGGPPPASDRALEFSGWSSEPDTDTLTPSSACPPPGALQSFASLMDEPDTNPDPSRPDERAPLATGSPEPEPPAPPPSSPALLERLNRPARTRRIVDALRQVCDGLAYIHARGLVHRDLKPTNVMVDDTRCVRLMDFGLVKLSSDVAHLTQHGKVVGTYRYMAPEQARGEPVDHRADLYSLGVILFEVLCGRPPFTARRPPELWREVLSRPPPSVHSLNPGAGPHLARLAEQLLAKDPRERLQSAEEAAERLGGG
jgi:serine/threonine protein kinase